ncbi:MAG: ubiquitin-activating E1 FCCH domain-containing protein [Rickettsiales bacterium]
MGQLLKLLANTNNKNLVIATGNLLFPYTFNSSSNWVHNSRTTHKTGNVPLVNPRIYFVNGIVIQNGNSDAYYDFDLNVGIEYNGTFYSAIADNGVTTKTLVKEWGSGVWSVFGLTIPANTVFHVINRRVASDGGVAGSYNVLTSHMGRRARQDGIVSGTNDTIDYTGGGYGQGSAGTFSSSGGVIQTPATVTGGGQDYSSGLSLGAYYGDAGRGQPAADYQSTPVAFVTGATGANPIVITTSKAHGYSSGQTGTFSDVGGMTELNSGTYTLVNVTSTTFELSGVDGTGFGTYTQGGEFLPSGVTGFASQEGGSVTSITVQTGGSGHDDANPPLVELGGGGGWGSGDQTNYGPCLILGESSDNTPFFISIVDSNGAGIGSAGGTGDLVGSSGALEQLIVSVHGYAFWKIGRFGDSASGWVTNHDKLLAFIDKVIADGLNISKAILVGALGTNDFSEDSALTASTMEGRIQSIFTEFSNKGIGNLWGTTIPPHTTSTDSYLTTTNQTAFSTPYDSGGEVVSFNERLRKNTGSISRDGYIDLADCVNDLTNNYKWRTDLYGGNIPTTKDGIHFSRGVGISYIRNNSLIPAINPTPDSGNLLVHLSSLDFANYTLSGSNISQWDDISGNGNHALQATSGDQPLINTYRHGSLYVPDFYNSSDRKLMTVDNFSYNRDGFTVYVVASFHNLGVAQCICGFYDSAIGASWRINLDVNDNFFLYYINSSEVLTDSNTIFKPTSTEIPYIFAFRFNNGVPTLRLNDNSQTNSALDRTSMKDVTSKYAIGGLLNNNTPHTAQPLQGAVLSHLFYDTVHTDNRMNEVVDELNNRYRVF